MACGSKFAVARVKVFRIIPQKASLKMLNQGDHNSFSGLFSVCLNTIEIVNI